MKEGCQNKKIKERKRWQKYTHEDSTVILQADTSICKRQITCEYNHTMDTYESGQKCSLLLNTAQTQRQKF